MKRGRVTRAIVGAARGTPVARLLRRRQSEAQLRRIFEGMAIGVVLIDAEGRLVESNPALEEMLGYTGEELRGLYFAEFGYSGDTAEDPRLYRELLQGGRNYYQLEKRYVKKSGELLWGRLTVSLLRGNGETGSEPPLTIGMLEDVTERRRAGEALKKSEERFHNLVENAGDAFFVHDLDGRFVDANQWACDSLGYTREELLRLSVTDIEKNFDPAALPELWGQVVAGVGDQIISAMIGLVRSLGMRVVAEGVETRDQLAWLQELGCDLAQGHHFSRPLPADEVAPFLTGSAA